MGSTDVIFKAEFHIECTNSGLPAVALSRFETQEVSKTGLYLSPDRNQAEGAGPAPARPDGLAQLQRSAPFRHRMYSAAIKRVE
ncbi:MAG: hypothetical protein P8Q48_25575 [Paracoccaceae bacterium]|nr:hypothetical protein [Paracoccaceae bacterium]